jgi:hypothetical protein
MALRSSRCFKVYIALAFNTIRESDCPPPIRRQLPQQYPRRNRNRPRRPRSRNHQTSRRSQPHPHQKTPNRHLHRRHPPRWRCLRCNRLYEYGDRSRPKIRHRYPSPRRSLGPSLYGRRVKASQCCGRNSRKSLWSSVNTILILHRSAIAITLASTKSTRLSIYCSRISAMRSRS